MICKYCGSQIDDKAVLCVFCKKEVKKSLFRFPRFGKKPSSPAPVPPSVQPVVKASFATDPAELRQQSRAFQADWLEAHYDFNTLEGIQSIPVKKDLPGAPAPNSSVVSHTGEVYYHLHTKAREYLEAGEFDLAIACQRKSNELFKAKYGTLLGRDESYYLVKILARAGRIEEAQQEKDAIDLFYRSAEADLACESNKRVKNTLRSFGTDLVIMDAHGSVCPECAKYQGRVYSISGRSARFPRAPNFFFTTGVVHEGCSHSFSPYFDGVNSADLAYTLSVHPIKNKSYTKDIVAFSNRPFVDDRTDECKRLAEEARKKQAQEEEARNQYEQNMIEVEYAKGIDQRNYLWLKENLPEKCPKSFAGFRRMKSQNTKNYQLLKQASAELGRDI